MSKIRRPQRTAKRPGYRFLTKGTRPPKRINCNVSALCGQNGLNRSTLPGAPGPAASRCDRRGEAVHRRSLFECLVPGKRLLSLTPNRRRCPLPQVSLKKRSQLPRRYVHRLGNYESLAADEISVDLVFRDCTLTREQALQRINEAIRTPPRG